MRKITFLFIAILMCVQPVFAKEGDTISFLDKTFSLIDTDLITVPSHDETIVYHFILNKRHPNLVFGAHSDGAGQWFSDLKVDDLIFLTLDGITKKYRVKSVDKILTDFFFVSVNKFYKKDKLILYTCYYKDGATSVSGRVIVNATLIK